MSRVGKKIIVVPAGVEVTLAAGNVVTVKGPKGTLTKKFNDELTINIENNEITVARPNDLPAVRAIHGTTRALINNMVVGLEMALGYSHPVVINSVEGIKMTVDKNTTIHIEGIEKDVVGQVAADIRSKRAPEPYKGKGVKYSDEVIRRKEGKKS